MKKNVLSIEINAPVEVVFEFTRNPNNTSKWTPFVLEEKVSDPVIGVGTIYRQKMKDGNTIKDSAIVVNR